MEYVTEIGGGGGGAIGMFESLGGSSSANVDKELVLDIKEMFESSRQQSSLEMFESLGQQSLIGSGGLGMISGSGGLGMISVPAHLRKLDEQAFTPQLISIGPIHLSNVKLQSTKKYKVQLCESFLRWTRVDLNDLVGFIRSCEKEFRSYYAENILSSITRDDLVRMILEDAMFIFGYFCNQVLELGYLGLGLENRIPDWMHPYFKLDMVLLENQLPLSVLKKLFKRTFSDDLMNISTIESLRKKQCRVESNEEFLLVFAVEFFECYNPQRISPQIFMLGIENFTDLVRLFYLNLSKPSPKRSSGRAKLSYSATQLHEAGVKFKEVQECDRHGDRHFLDLRFDLKNGVLEIPCFTLNAENICLIRNISALEQSLYVGHAYVTDFFVMLDFLIDTSKDVDLLCDKGILINYLGDSNAAASTINGLNINTLRDYMNSDYSKICEDLNVFYKKPWHRWRATLWRQYFSTPWRAASTSAAIILLLLTLAQTVCSFKSTNW